MPHPDFFPLVNNGSIKAIKGEIKSIKERSVLLASGDELPCDVIVAATGYKPVRNFLPKDVAELKEKDGLWLYRQMVHPNHPGLIFLNSETTTFTNITTASIQARWLAEMLAGTFTLPFPGDVWPDRRDAEVEAEYYAERGCSSSLHDPDAPGTLL